MPHRECAANDGRRTAALCAALIGFLLATTHSSRLGASLASAEPPSDSVVCINARGGGTFALHAVAVSSAGTILSDTTSRRRLCVGAVGATHSVAAADGEGGAYVAWLDAAGEDCDIRLSRVTAAGGVSAGWPEPGFAVCAERGTQSQPTLVTAGAGVLLAWRDYRNPSKAAIFLQRVTSSGAVAAGWPEGGREAATSPAGQSDPTLLKDPSGATWLIWQQGRAGERRLFGQRLQDDGTASAGWEAGPRELIACAADNHAPLLASDPTGSIYLAWRARTELSDSVRVVRLNGQGLPASGWTAGGVAMGTGQPFETPSALASDSAGVFVAWVGVDEDTSCARVSRVSSSGVFGSGWDPAGRVLRGADSDETSLLSDGSRGVYFATMAPSLDTEAAIYVGRFTATGATSSGWPSDGLQVSSDPGNEHQPSLASTPSGGVLVAWSTAELADGGVLLAMGRTLEAPLPALTRVQAFPDLVRLEWSLVEPPDFSIQVERRESNGDWTPVRTIEASADGHLVFEDGEVAGALDATYRLRLVKESLQAVTPEILVPIPQAVTFGFHAIRLQGSRLLVFASLPSHDDARLELFDVQGRRAFVQRLRVEHAGEQELLIQVGRSLRSGVYFARLAQGKSQGTMRFTLVR